MGPESASLAGASPVHVTFVRQPQGYVGPELATQWTKDPFTLWLYIDDTVSETSFEVVDGRGDPLRVVVNGREVQGSVLLHQAEADGDRGPLWFVKLPVRFPASGCYQAVYRGQPFGERRIEIRIDPAP